MIARRMLAQASSYFPEINRAVAKHPEEINKALNIIIRMLESGIVHVTEIAVRMMS